MCLKSQSQNKTIAYAPDFQMVFLIVQHSSVVRHTLNGLSQIQPLRVIEHPPDGLVLIKH